VALAGPGEAGARRARELINVFVIDCGISPENKMKYDKYIVSLLDLPENTLWFCGSIILADVERWKKENIDGSIMAALKTGVSFLNDEPLIMYALRGKITPLPPKFNSILWSEFTGGMDADAMEKRVKEDDIRILHCVKCFGDRPWHKNTLHPAAALFDKYLALSPWRDMRKESPRRLVLRVFKVLYTIFPNAWVKRLFGIAWNFEASMKHAKIIRKDRGLLKTD
jgi:lipopolysaccharide biosynthesis glycosyltransferase